MSKIYIYIDADSVKPQVLMALQRTLGWGLGELRSAIGTRRPLFEHEIFDADYESHAAKIRAIVMCLENESIPMRVYEIAEGETIESVVSANDCEISVEILNNILRAADAELDRWLGQ